MNIYHITSRKSWIEATRKGTYTAPSLAEEGFIHCSTAAQVLHVARQYFLGQSGLVLLVLHTSRLAPDLRWEESVPPAGLESGAAFPHVYGPIPVEAVLAALDFEPDKGGDFVLPRLPVENNGARRH